MVENLLQNITPKKQKLSSLKLTLRKMWHLRFGVVGGFFIFLFICIAIFAPLLAPHDPYSQDIMIRLLPPSWMDNGNLEYLLGTDHLGRDILSRLMYGTRISLIVGISAVILEVIIGISLGIMAGYYGGKVDAIISFMVNCMMGFPFILLTLSLVAVLGSNLNNIILALGLTGWPIFTRVARIETMKIRQLDYIIAARSLALSVRRIMVRHILPNLLPSLCVIATVEVARAIIMESLLSFLGIGIKPPTPSWGVMLAEGRDYMLDKWWLAFFPGFAIFLAALGINLLGDALRDILDPYLRKT